jgi:fructuronate reductase
MIDKIVPRPNPVIANQLIEFGLENMNPITTSKGTFIAPFVNAEKIQYLVIEDKFPNGRPSLEKSGVYFTSKKIVDQVEKLKVTTCLNPLHTALAVVGCLLGYDKIYEEVQNKHLLELIKQIGYNEGLKVVENPKIINPKKFIDEVIYKRLPNPFVPDTPQRIATDTSLKVGIRFGVTIKAYAENPQLSISSLIGIPFAIAA